MIYGSITSACPKRVHRPCEKSSVAPVIAGVRRALQDQDPNVPLLRVRMMEEYVNSQLAHERLVAYLSTFFGILALGLTCVGLYGVIAYAVTQRTREIAPLLR